MLTKQRFGHRAPPFGQFMYYNKLFFLLSIVRPHTVVLVPKVQDLTLETPKVPFLRKQLLYVFCLLLLSFLHLVLLHWLQNWSQLCYRLILIYLLLLPMLLLKITLLLLSLLAVSPWIFLLLQPLINLLYSNPRPISSIWWRVVPAPLSY